MFVFHSLLLVSLTTTSVLATPDYVYEEYDSEYSEEVADVKDSPVDFSNYNVRILSEGQNIELAAGTTIRLPCKVDDLPPDLHQYMLWKRLDKKNTIISVGGNVLHPDYKDRTKIELGKNGGFLKLVLVQEEDAGKYQCSINMGKKTVSVTHTLGIKGDYTGPGNLTLSEGDDMILTCNSSGNTQVSWTWEGGKLPTGEMEFTGNVLRINAVTRGQGGRYHCKAGSNVEKEVVVVVQYKPEVSMKEEMISSITGNVAELVCIVRGIPVPTVQWSREGNEVAQDKRRKIIFKESSRNILAIEDLDESDSGSYTCTATNGLGSSQQSVQLTAEVSSKSKHPLSATLAIFIICLYVFGCKD